MGALQGEGSPKRSLVLDADGVGGGLALKPRAVGFGLGGVRDKKKGAGVEAVTEQVIQDSPGFIEKQRVMAAARGEVLCVVGQEPIEKAPGICSLDADVAHVGDIKKTCCVAHRMMLLKNPLKLERHAPPREIGHPRAVGFMEGVER